MCLAIVKPAGREIPFKNFRRGFIRNPHGAGFAYAKGGQLFVEKGFFHIRDFWAAYKDKITTDTPALIHFRWSNVSVQNGENCHPWRINNELALIHNGTLEPYTDLRNGLSDTGNFTKIVLTPLFDSNPTLWKNQQFSSIISRSIEYSKIAILSSSGEYVIYNEGFGLWDGGVWYSNNDGVRKLRKNKKKVVKKEEVAAAE